MTLKELCIRIRMPDEVTEEIIGADIGIAPDCASRLIRDLCCRDTYAGAYEQAKVLFAGQNGVRGIKMLKLTLKAASETKKKYDKTSIDERVFFDTMGCFSRFVREYKQSFGAYGFDRGWWVGRQLSVLLVRLGELEYELSEYKGKNAISIHIPSDADLSRDCVLQSICTAKTFFGRHFPEYENCDCFCESWLLSPALKKMLAPASNILRFAENFDIVEINEDATDYIRWVYKVPGLAPEFFCEQTSLQRNIKNYVLAGGKIGTATGILKTDFKKK